MHTFAYEDWSISYNSDLSGEAVIDSSGKVNGVLCRFNRARIPCALLKAFTEHLGHDIAGPAYKRMAESEINRLTERAEMAEADRDRLRRTLEVASVLADFIMQRITVSV